MTSQVADLRQAEADLRQVIAELDEVTRKEFTKTFEAVAAEFKQIFTRLFGGGSARLVLTDPDHLTETGIEIEARLPGRREQGLSLLSGGERSLTAISLVFALLKVSPTPVCVMDEVDAMLDEANVGRFRDLLDELSEHTQFIGGHAQPQHRAGGRCDLRNHDGARFRPASKSACGWTRLSDEMLGRG